MIVERLVIFMERLVILVLLRHVAPIAAGHVVELFPGVDALADADGLEVGAPEVLEQLVVGAEHGDI